MTREWQDEKMQHSKGDVGCTGIYNTDEPLCCVFSTAVTIKVGTGTTARKQNNKLLWYVKQQDEDVYGVRKINPSFLPTGDEKIINREELLAEYTPEVMIHNQRVTPAMLEVSQRLSRGDKHRADGEMFSAEMEYDKVLDVDEKNVRAIFGLGLVYMARDDMEKGMAIFEELVGMEAAFNLEHKHLFNEFGIQLRKHELYAQAVEYYGRAVELTREDENLYYNLSRAHYELGDWEGCSQGLVEALTLDPAHSHAIALRDIILVLSDNDELCRKNGKPQVPEDVVKNLSNLSVAPRTSGDLDGRIVKLD